MNLGHRVRRIVHVFLICMLLGLSGVNSDADINPYKILGVSRSAGEKEIKNVYRKMAKEW